MSRIEFYNQITIVITIDIKKKDPTKTKTRNINTKIFQNGTVHMTGCQVIKDAKRAVKVLVKCIQALKFKVKLPETLITIMSLFKVTEPDDGTALIPKS